MKLLKKFAIFVLSLCLVCCAAFPCAAAESQPFKTILHRSFWNALESVTERIVTAIADAFPTPASWEQNDDTSDAFYPGTAQMLSAPAPDAAFSLGYDTRSLLDGMDGIIGKLYVGGSIAFKDKFVTEVFDDLMVRSAAITDGSGRGTALFLVVDAFGLSSPDVREIRRRIAAALPDEPLQSITVSVLHQHSAVDTFGMNGNILEMALLNPLRNLLHLKTVNGKNNRYMEHLFEQCVASAAAAVNDMRPGRLYYGTADQRPYLIDKREPTVCDPNFNRFRFIPDDGSRETWLISSEIHCVGNGAAQREITGDYPYYAARYLDEQAGVNALFYLGAQQSTSQNHTADTVVNFSESNTSLQGITGFGISIAQTLMQITEETEVAPLLNIRMKEVTLPVLNPILYLAAKVGMINANVVRTADGIGVRTELGYAELGKDLAFAIVPGELEAALAYGGVLNGKEAWRGVDWPYPSMQQILTDAGISRKLMVIGLSNDQIGYIVPDNNYIPMIAEESNSIEFVSLGSRTASTLMAAFWEIIK